MRKLPAKVSALIGRFNDEEKRLIESAYFFARQKHHGQKRRSGSPYISHPLQVGLDLMQDGADSQTVAAGFLHDLIEDTDTQSIEIANLFGRGVEKIVSGVTKISALRIQDKQRIFSDEELFLSSVDNYRKILFATASDPRVIIIKLYDRLHNAKTLEWIPIDKRKFYARETIEIYAAIAERLGMGKLKGELEDISFPYAYPLEYRDFKEKIKDIYKNPIHIIKRATPIVRQKIVEAGLKEFFISGRAKFYYSLYKKLKVKGDIKYIFDIAAMRIIVKTVPECYQVLGLIHAHFEPLPNQIDDYIARPKETGYQSIHTTVKDQEGDIFEVQIRTEEMHRFAEYGIASHWNYKESKYDNFFKKHSLEWIKELDKLKEISKNSDFLEHLNDQLFSDKVFVFTPKGEVIKLLKDSTPIDFAYHIHDDIGSHCFGAKINGRLLPLSTKLRTADTVEIITAKNVEPRNGWLDLVKTSQARHKIRSYLRQKQENSLFETGKRKLFALLGKFNLPKVSEEEAEKSFGQSRLPFKSFRKALVSLADNSLAGVKFLRTLYPTFRPKQSETKKPAYKQIEKELKSIASIRHQFAKCCKPKKSDPVIGYVSKSHVITIHKKDCPAIKNADPRRLLEV